MLSIIGSVSLLNVRASPRLFFTTYALLSRWFGDLTGLTGGRLKYIGGVYFRELNLLFPATLYCSITLLFANV